MRVIPVIVALFLGAFPARADERPPRVCASWTTLQAGQVPDRATPLEPSGFQRYAPNVLRFELPASFAGKLLGPHRFQNSYTLCHRDRRFRNYGLLADYATAEGWWQVRMEEGRPVLYLTDPDDDYAGLYLEYDGGWIERRTALDPDSADGPVLTVGERLGLPRAPKALHHYPYDSGTAAWVRVEAVTDTTFALGANGVHISDWWDIFENVAQTDPLFLTRRMDDPAVLDAIFSFYRRKGLFLTHASLDEYPSTLAVGLAGEGHCGTLLRHGAALLSLLGYRSFSYGLADDRFGHTLLFAQQGKTRLIVDSYFLHVVPVPKGLPAGDESGDYTHTDLNAESEAARAFYLHAPRRIFYQTEAPPPPVLLAERILWHLKTGDVLLLLPGQDLSRQFLQVQDTALGSRAAILIRTLAEDRETRTLELPFPLRRIEATPGADGVVMLNGRSFPTLADANAWLLSVPRPFVHAVRVAESYAGATFSFIIEANGALVPPPEGVGEGDLTLELIEGRAPLVTFQAP